MSEYTFGYSPRTPRDIEHFEKTVSRTGKQATRHLAPIANRVRRDIAKQDAATRRVQNAMMSKLDHDLEAVHAAQAAAQSPREIADREKVIDLIRQNRNSKTGSSAGKGNSENDNRR